MAYRRAATAFEKYQKLARIFCLKPAINATAAMCGVKSTANPRTRTPKLLHSIP
jgi:hypothetical protein